MDIFDLLTLIGGLCLFLFGMNLMGSALEKRAGGRLKTLLGRLTTGKAAGFFTGLGVTAIIQSSSATTVMVVGFVNSGIMTLRQAINVIMGANVGTTVTAWLLSLTGIESSNIFVRLLKPSSFTPVLALIGIILFMGFKSSKKRDTATVLLGFATLMFGMETMSGAVSGLKNVPEFANILVMFSNPVLGVIAGAVLTAVLQSSSASVGILQALSGTGQINFGAAVPIIMGQNIGTCVTALISSVGANRNARRASFVHLSFNIFGTVIMLSLFSIIRAVFDISAFTNASADELGIAVVHTVFNLLCTAVMLPLSGLLERLSYKVIPDSAETPAAYDDIRLDERLMATPVIAIERCRLAAVDMAESTERCFKNAVLSIHSYNADTAEKVRTEEKRADKFEDVLGNYLVKLSSYPLSAAAAREAAKLLHIIGDLERISDHAVNLVESAEELNEKEISFTGDAKTEISALITAVSEVVGLACKSFTDNDLAAAERVEPLEQVADELKDKLRSQHILRMQRGECSVVAGFIWSDLITDLERVSDHCSNIAGCVIEMSHHRLKLHNYLGGIKKNNPRYNEIYAEYAKKYLE